MLRLVLLVHLPLNPGPTHIGPKIKKEYSKTSYHSHLNISANWAKNFWHCWKYADIFYFKFLTFWPSVRLGLAVETRRVPTEGQTRSFSFFLSWRPCNVFLLAFLVIGKGFPVSRLNDAECLYYNTRTLPPPPRRRHNFRLLSQLGKVLRHVN